MNLNGLTAAIAATGDALNAAEVTVAQLRAENEQLRTRVEELTPDDDEPDDTD